jgi:hypothetical protein
VLTEVSFIAGQKSLIQTPVESFQPRSFVAPVLQRKCACGEHTLTGTNCEQCRKGERASGQVQRAAVHATDYQADVPPVVHEVLRSAGQPLDPATRVSMESRFAHDFSFVPTYAPQSPARAGLAVGPAEDAAEQEADRTANAIAQMPETSGDEHRQTARPGHQLGYHPGYDFSQVRIHTGAKAAESASSLNARAYTVGQHIVFGRGQYLPPSLETRRLLAHELSHVIQQKSAGSLLQRKPAGIDPTKIRHPKLSIYMAGWTAENFFKALATNKAKQIKAVQVEPDAYECPEKVTYGATPYATGEDIVNALVMAYACTGSKVNEIHIFGHSGSSGLYGSDYEEHGLYSEDKTEEERKAGARHVVDLPMYTLANDVIIVFHGCRTAEDTDNFAQAALEAILGTSPKARIYGHSESGTCGRDNDWKEFSKKHPKGKRTDVHFKPPKKE